MCASILLIPSKFSLLCCALVFQPSVPVFLFFILCLFMTFPLTWSLWICLLVWTSFLYLTASLSASPLICKSFFLVPVLSQIQFVSLTLACILLIPFTATVLKVHLSKFSWKTNHSLQFLKKQSDFVCLSFLQMPYTTHNASNKPTQPVVLRLCLN